MKLSRTALLLAVAMVTASALAQQKPQPPTDLVTRVYRVDDLLMPPKNYPFRGSALPTTSPQGEKKTLGGGAGMGGMGGGAAFGGGGGFGGGMGGGGGFFNVQSDQKSGANSGGGVVTGGGFGGGFGGLGGGIGGFGVGQGGSEVPAVPRFELADLVNVITGVIAPEQWEHSGGPGAIQTLGGMLVVSQTPDVHNRIEQLLAEVRTQGGAARTVSIRAQWLRLNGDQLAQLLPRPGQVDVAPDALARLGSDALAYEGRVSCFSGQTVHIVSGRRRNVLTGAIPVVGDSVGYSMQSQLPNLGVLLQITPLVSSDDRAAVVDVQSSVTSWEKEGESVPAVGDGSSLTAPLDRVNLRAEQLATTVRLPLGHPVLVGGLCSAPAAADEQQDVGQIYLVIEVNAAAR